MKLFRKYLIIFFISYLSVNYAFSTNVTSELNYYKKINRNELWIFTIEFFFILTIDHVYIRKEDKLFNNYA